MPQVICLISDTIIIEHKVAKHTLFHMGKPTCHLAPTAPVPITAAAIQMKPMMTVPIAWGTERPRPSREEPLVQPTMLIPIVNQYPTKVSGPQDRRSGGRGTLSRLSWVLAPLSITRYSADRVSYPDVILPDPSLFLSLRYFATV